VLPDMQYPLPSPALDIPVDGANAPVYRISPDEPWRVLRTKWRVAGLVAGPIEGGGRASGYFTSASGVTIYRGTALGPDFEGDAFIADVGSNLVHRKKLRTNGVPFKAERAPDEQKSEFLASRDVWFRPVAFANAPDGALYIADMYREVIEHPWSLPPNIKKFLDLNSGNDRGRIYRAVSTNFTQPKLPKLSRASNEELVALLAHPNGWHRDTASRLLYERTSNPFDPKSVTPTNFTSHATAELIRKQLRSDSAFAQLHSLSALEGLQVIYSGMLSIRAEDLKVALKSQHADVREHAARFLPRYTNLLTELSAQPTNDPSPRVRYQFAWALAREAKNVEPALFATLAENAKDVWEQHAVRAAVSRVPGLAKQFPEAFARKMNAQNTASKSPAPIAAPTASRAEAIKKYSRALTLTGNSGKGRVIYQERCASCHRLFGQGTPVGPDLESVRTAGKETTFINILDPNREVPPRFATVEITTNDEPVSGVLANDAANGVTLRQANGIETFVPRKNIKSSRTSTTSLMPEGLEEGLTPADLADLLAYIAGE
jgi:putative heme-binding domain-containing protein